MTINSGPWTSVVMVPPSGIINYRIHPNLRQKFFADFSSRKKWGFSYNHSQCQTHCMNRAVFLVCVCVCVCVFSAVAMWINKVIQLLQYLYTLPNHDTQPTKCTVNFMVTPCINNIQHFNNQLTHTTLKNVELLKHFKISKTASTCFGLQGNHHQGATIST